MQGSRAGSTEAHEEKRGGLPPGWSFTNKRVLGYKSRDGSLVAMANITTDMLATGAWHIGLFMVATARHGSGDAHRLISGLERWAVDNGAAWLRPGVVQGNSRAERFRERPGYIEVRTREGVQIGAQTHTLRVMVKPLADGVLQDQLTFVPRDRPEPPRSNEDL